MVTFLLLGIQPAAARMQAQQVKPVGAMALCLPGIYLYTPGDCVPAGPSAYLSQLAEKGFSLPLAPLPATPADPLLSEVPFRYGEVRNRNAPVFPSVEAAMDGRKGEAVARIDSSFAYISYSEMQEINGRKFYFVKAGGWMTANDVSRIGYPPKFQGLTFTRTPNNSFGWVLSYLSPGPVETKRTPGLENEDYTGHVLNQLEVVQIFAVEKVGDSEWFMVGPDEWVVDRVIARVVPNPNPPEGVSGDRWIEVNLHEQTLSVYDRRQLVFATVIASGLEPFWTRPGVFQISEKLDSTPMRGAFEADRSDAYYLEDVPWTMYFDGARALHGAYWRTKLGFAQSHGCVNLSVGDAHWLYDWASLGDWVYVWDPSGKTPTDPKLYGDGGA
jgi:hypothetical protein